MITNKSLFTLGILLILSLVALCQGKWELKRDDNGIEVYTRKPLSGSLKELRVTCELNATKKQLINTLEDIGEYGKWVYSTKKNDLLKTVNSQQLIYYTACHLPWPLKDRDLIVELSILPGASPDQFKIEAKSLPNYLPGNPDFIRVPYSLAQWNVKVINEHTLQVDYTFSVDPGGNIPVWMVNSTLATGPYNSFVKLKQLLKNMNTGYAAN